MRLLPSFRAVAGVALFVVMTQTFPTPPVGQTFERSAVAALVGKSDTIDRLAMLQDRATRNATSAPDAQVRPAPGHVTGWWGERRPGHMHTGVDIDGETGDPVVAAARGTVSYAGLAPKGYTGYGQIVVLDHAGFQTVYAHLSRIDVTVGQVLLAGTQLGGIGRTGSATGTHLHFEVRVDGKPVDPATYIRVL